MQHPLIHDIYNASTPDQQFNILQQLADGHYRRSLSSVSDRKTVRQFLRTMKDQHRQHRVRGGGTPSTYLAQLEQLYPNIEFIHSEQSHGRNDTTYGEMTYNGIRQFLQEKSPEHTVFLDIGSGNGKIPLYVASNPHIRKSIGVEIMPERHAKAIDLRNQLQGNREVNNVEFQCGDITNMSIQQLVGGQPTLTWISNLCFPLDINHAVLQKLDEELPHGSRVIMSQEPSIPLQNLRRRDPRGDINVEMTWAPDSIVYVYDKK